MHTLRLEAWAALCLTVAFAAGRTLTPDQARALPPPVSRPVVFARDIQPIFEARCVNCHGHGRNKGGFQLDTRATLIQGGDSGPAVVEGRSQESLLIELVSGLNPDNIMPKKGSRLTVEQIGLLRAWIDQGLGWDGQVTFAKQAPRNLGSLAPPSGIDLSSPVSPIDQLLRGYLTTHGVGAPVRTSDRIFARRASLDAIGLLPDPSELEAFAGDQQPDKRGRLVRRLLGRNREYAEHWLSFWNDLLRNDYSGTGYIDGGRKSISAWLYSVLETNLPYDQFVAQLINPPAGAEGFTKGIVWRGAVNASQTPEMQAAQNISQVFMGVNLKCASCHDSFINDWLLSDAYGLAAVYSDRPLEMFECDKPTGHTVEARFIYPELGEIDPKADKPARLKQLAALITEPKDGRLARTMVNRLWARCFGHGLIEPLDDMEQPAWNQDLLDWLAWDLAAHGYDLKHTLERILTSEAYQMPAINLEEGSSKEFVFRGPGIRRLSAEQFRDALGQVTGVWFDRAELPVATNEVRACLVSADPLSVALGRPNREQVATSRASAATTLQALELTNGKTLAWVLERGAKKMVAANPASADLVDRLFQTALGRKPNSSEKQFAATLAGNPVQAEGVADLLWAVAMQPEFQLIY